MRWTNISYRVRRFSRDEDGATTVDWVVLTAAIVGLAAGVILVFSNESNSYAQRLGDHLSTMDIPTF